jgi:nucleotide-binding universal stress UspA family protein
MAGEVVVGVDGTFCSLAAVRWAADVAAARRSELVLVHALGGGPHQHGSAGEGATAETARAVLDRADEYVHLYEHELKVRTEVDTDTPARCLARRSGTSALVVVGTRRTTQLPRVHSGSLAYEIVAGATCSAVVVPPVADLLDRGVVVGVDGSPEGSVALRSAAGEAERLGSGLVVVHAWQEPAGLRTTGWLPPDVGAGVRERADATLRASVAALRSEHPVLQVRTALVKAPAAAALLAAAAHAQLLVLGSRRMTGAARAPLRTTSHAVVLHARCAVLVARIGETC